MHSLPSISLFAATALLTAVASVAQPQSTTPSGNQPTTTGSAGYGTTTDTTTGTTSARTGTMSGTLQAQDAEFLRKAMAAGREEIQNAQLAMQNAQRSETRSAAQMVLDDHQESNQRLQQLAQRKGWPTMSPSTAASAQSDQPRSSRLTSGGGDFDSRYIADEIRHHREAIAEYRKQASAGSDPELRKFATDSLPKLEHHLDMLENANARK